MKIAFDGTVLHGLKSGVGYYCEELLKALLAANHTDQFLLFSHRPLAFEAPSSNGNLQILNSTTFPIRAIYLHTLLPRLLDSANPDLCHYTNFLAPVTQTHPYVVTIHDMGLEVLPGSHPLAKRLYTRRLIPYVARKARLILTNSDYSKWEIMRHLGVSEERIRVTPLAASAEFKPVPSEARRPYFLFVGNLEPRKNLERLIEAFARMPNKDHELLIVGNAWYRGQDPRDKVTQLGLSGRVRFLGYVPRNDLPALFSGATAFVYPSLLEGFGMPVVEAMACGTPVITSRTSSLKEVAGDAALLVNPSSVAELTDAMTQLAEDRHLRAGLRQRGLRRAGEFSWQTTARLTLAAYQDALEPATIRKHCARQEYANEACVEAAVHKTIAYARLFNYPLHETELHDRLFDVRIDDVSFRQMLAEMRLPQDAQLLALRAEREKISDHAIRGAEPHLKTLVSMPFVRMLAFSGSTAHRNMTSTEDVDLFMIVEDGRLWSVFLAFMVWAKVRGLRKTLCLNYVISEEALSLYERDPFTAQQAASLKPFYGKPVYDRFIDENQFLTTHFPNFAPERHRGVYAELVHNRLKPIFESILRLGPIQVFEWAGRTVLGAYLKRKAQAAAGEGECDVLLERQRLKLHMISHKRETLDTIPRPLTPSAQ